MNWDEKVNDFYEQHDELTLPLSFDSLDHFEPSMFTKLNVQMAKRIKVVFEYRYLLLTYPANNTFTESFVFYHTLNSLINGDNDIGLLSLESLKSGTKIKIGSAVGMFAGCFDENFCQTESGKAKYVKIECKNDKSKYFPIASIRNLLPWFTLANAKAALSKLETFVSEQSRTAVSGDDTPIERIKSKLQYKMKSNVYITDPIEMRDQFQSFTLDGIPLSQLMTIERLKYLRSDTVNSEQLGTIGNSKELIIAPNFGILATYLEQNPEIQIATVFVDGDSFDISDYEEYFSDYIKDIADNVIILQSQTNCEDNTRFIDDGFSFFSWNSSMVTQSMIDINKSYGTEYLYNFYHRECKAIIPEEDKVTPIFSELRIWRDKIVDSHLSIQNLFKSINKALYFCLQGDFLPPSDRVQILKSEIEKNIKAVEVPEISRFLFNHELKQALVDIGKRVIDLLNSDNLNKPLSLKQYCRDNANDFKGKRICIIATSSMDSEEFENGVIEFEDYTQFDYKQVKCLTVDDFLTDSESFDVVIIPQWIRESTMKQLLLSNKGKSFYLSLYHIEYYWMRSALNHWNTIENNTNQVEIDDITWPKFNPVIIDNTEFSKPDVTIKELPTEEQTRKDRFVHKQYENTDSDELVDTKYISFNDGTSAYYGLGFNFTKITTHGSDVKCSSIPCKDIREGDVVMFFGSDDDVLVTTANKILKDEGHEEATDIASEWRTALTLAVTFQGHSTMVSKLQKGGISVIYQRLLDWLDVDGTTICPSKRSDLEIIADVVGDPGLKDDIYQIFKAAKIIKSARIRAGKQLSKSIKGNPVVLEEIKRLSRNGAFGMPVQAISVSTMEGRITILSVCDVSEMTKAPRSILKRRE